MAAVKKTGATQGAQRAAEGSKAAIDARADQAGAHVEGARTLGATDNHKHNHSSHSSHGDHTNPNSDATADTALALERHLRDREELLFTSRSISIGEMASTLAHEINQPVGTIVNVLRGVSARLARLPVAEEEQPLLAELHQGLKLALDQAQFASRIVGRIREFTQARQPEHKTLDLRALALDSVQLLDWEFSRQGVPVALDMPAPWWVVGDAVMLQQVMVNLLRNALQSHRELPQQHSRVTLRLQALGDREVELAITDQGCGISAAAEAALFVPFQSSKPDGMGIGLNICRSFVELHQGRLWFTRNAAPPGGCTFHLALPAAVPPPEE